MGKRKAASFLIMMLGLFLLLQSFRVEAQTSELIVSITPIQISTLNVGDSFTVYVQVTNVQQLQGAQVQFTYDPTVLNVINVVEGPFLSSGGASTIVAQLYAEVNNETQPAVGEVFYASAVVGSPVSGGGVLLNVTFTVISDGASRLHLLPHGFDQHQIEIGTFFLDVNFQNLIPTAANLKDAFYGSPMTLTAKPEQIEPGGTTTLSGSLYGPVVGLISSVSIEYSLTGGNWTTVASVPANASGFFTYQWVGNESNDYVFRVYFVYQNETAVSPIVVVTVLHIAPSHLYVVYDSLAILVIIVAGLAIFVFIRNRRKPIENPAPL